MSDGWTPEDGAGYIPTEEGGSGRSEVPVWSHSTTRVKTKEGLTYSVLACKLSSDDVNDDGTVNMPPSGECDCYEAMEPCTDMDGLDIFLEQLELEAQDVAENPRPRQTQAYANGVAAGIRYVKNELEELVNND